MGDSNGSKRHGDFMCKRSLCFVSGHLQSNCHLFFVSSYYGLDFLLSGFERAEGINSQMKGQKKKKDHLVFFKRKKNYNFVGFGELLFFSFSFCHDFALLENKYPSVFYVKRKCFLIVFI